MKKLLIASALVGLALSQTVSAKTAIATAADLANNTSVASKMPLRDVEIFNDTLDQWNSVRIALASDPNNNIVCNAVGSTFSANGHKCIYEGGNLAAICMGWDEASDATISLEGGGDHDLMYGDGAGRGSRLCFTR